jgi:hypothetical protein
VLPTGGLSAGEAIEAYLNAAPMAGLAKGCGVRRLSVRQFRHPPATLWRRTVPAPRGLNYSRYPEHLQRWNRFEMQLRALPGPKYLAQWIKAQRSEFWRKFAIHRLLADAAAGAIVAYDSQARDVPATHWESDVDFDPERGDVYCRHDSRLPLRRALRFHSAADIPAAAAARAALALGDVKAAVLAALVEHAEELSELKLLSDRVALLAELLPFPAPTIRSYVYRAAAQSRARVA